MTRRLVLRHYSVNIAGALVALLVTVVTIPIYIRTIGDARYGVLSVVWLLLGYVGFLDLGLSRAAENALAKATPEGRASVLVTAGVANLAMGVLGSFVILLLASALFGHVIHSSDTVREEVMAAIPWVAVLFPAALVSGVFNGALESKERFVAANVLSVSGLAVGQVAPLLCAVFYTSSLSVIIPVAVIARLFSIAVSVAYVVRLEAPLRPRHFDVSLLRGLMAYGGWVTVTSVIGPFLVSLDQLVIGSRLGAEAIAYYSVPMNIVSRAQLIAAALSRTLFPSLSRSSGDEARTAAERSTSLLAIISAAGFVALIFIIENVIQLWIGEGFAERAATVARVLLLGGWINGVAFIPYALLQAQGRPDLTAKFHLAEIVPYIALLWILSTEFGLVGAAIAWSVRTTVDAALMIGAARFSWAVRFRVLTLLVFMTVACGLASVVTVSLPVSVGLALITGLLVLGFGVCVEPQAGPLLSALVRRATGRFHSRRPSVRRGGQADHAKGITKIAGAIPEQPGEPS